jgi:hypothetical protein
LLYLAAHLLFSIKSQADIQEKLVIKVIALF